MGKFLLYKKKNNPVQNWNNRWMKNRTEKVIKLWAIYLYTVIAYWGAGGNPTVTHSLCSLPVENLIIVSSVLHQFLAEAFFLRNLRYHRTGPKNTSLPSTRAMQLNWDVRWCVFLWCPLIGTGLRTSSPAGKELMQIQSSLTEEEDVKAIATSLTKQNKASAMWELLLPKGTPKKSP